MILMSDTKFEKNWLCCKNDITNSVSFNTSRGKSENLNFDMLVLSIASKVPGKLVEPSYLL